MKIEEKQWECRKVKLKDILPNSKNPPDNYKRKVRTAEKEK